MNPAEYNSLAYDRLTTVGEARDVDNGIVEFIPKYRDDLRSMVGRLENISDRIGRRMDAKRSSASTRLVFTVASIAAVLSGFSLLSQIVGPLV